MEKTYIIIWKARDSGRTGEGKKLMDKAEAESLAAELNQEYPEYEHLVVNTAAPTAEPQPAVEAAEAQGDFRQAQPSPSPVTFSNGVTTAHDSEVTAYDNHSTPATLPEKEAA